MEVVGGQKKTPETLRLYSGQALDGRYAFEGDGESGGQEM